MNVAIKILGLALLFGAESSKTSVSLQWATNGPNSPLNTCTQVLACLPTYCPGISYTEAFQEILGQDHISDLVDENYPRFIDDFLRSRTQDRKNELCNKFLDGCKNVCLDAANKKGTDRSQRASAQYAVSLYHCYVTAQFPKAKLYAQQAYRNGEKRALNLLEVIQGQFQGS